MTKMRVIPVMLLMLLCACTAFAQRLVGDWQGTLPGPRTLRLVLHIDRADDAVLRATLGSLDQSSDWGQTIPVDSVSVQGDKVTLAVAPLRATFANSMRSSRS